MLRQLLLLLQALRLKPRPNDLERVREGRRHDAGDNPRGKLMLPHSLQFLIEHVVKPAEGALLDAARQSSAEKPVQTLPPPNIHDSRVDTGIPVEIRQLESGLYDVERVGQQRARQSRQRRYRKVLKGSHIGHLKGPQASKINIASEGSLERGSDHALIEALYSVCLVDVLTGAFGILEDAAFEVERLELPRGQHQRHLDVLERLQQRSRDHPAHHAVEALVAYHLGKQITTT